ncbi:MAG TPA: hypothetical protein PLP17_13330, partial [Oligoflexia bacterium]|nr:hypothetical protein [Oligoflexia bacterium]
LQITLPEGSAGTEADLYVLLGGADRKLFSSIFAFGLEELSSREMLDAEETRARIFSAGITGAGNSAQSIISKLDAANQQLLRPKAAAKITTLIERLEAVAGELFEWQGKLERYPELLKHEMKCRQALKALAEEESRLQQDAHELRRLLDLWTPFCELRRAGAELEMLGPVPEHIEQAVEKVARLEEQRQALLGQMCEVNAASENAVRELSEQESRYQQHLEHLLAEVEYHCESAALQRDRLTSLPVQKKKISALTQALAEQLAAFGGTWTRENISSLPCFFANQEEGRVWQHVLGSLEQRVSQSTAGAEVALEKLRESEQRCEDLRQQLAKLPADGSALLDRQKGAVAEWRAAAQELSVLEEKLNYERSLRAEMESHLRFQRSAVKAFAFFFMCLAAALFIAGLMRTSFSDYTLSIPLFFAGAVLFVSGVVIFRRLKRTGLLGPASLANELKQSRRQVQIDAAQERIAQALEELELPLGSGRAAIDRLE